MNGHLTRAALVLALGSSLTPGAAAQGPAPSAASTDKTAAHKTLGRAQQAAGGRARLAAIRDLTRTSELIQAGTSSRAAQVVKVILPGAIHLMSDVNGVSIAAFSDGSRGWIASPWGVDDSLPAWQLRSAHLDVLRQVEVLLVSDAHAETTLLPVERRELETGPADGVRIVRKDAPEVTLWVDVKSGDPIRLEYLRPVEKGKSPSVVERFSDFRTSGGIRAPFKVSTLSDGVPYMESVVRNVTYNTGLTLEALAKKETPKTTAPLPPPLRR